MKPFLMKLLSREDNLSRNILKTGLFLLLIMVVSTGFSSCKTIATAPAVHAATEKKINDKSFSLQATYAIPLRMQKRYLTPDYNLTIRNDSAIAYLPYFGQAYSVPYNNSDGGIKFSKPMINYSCVYNPSRSSWLIHFTVKTDLEVFDFGIEIFDNGSANINVNSTVRDPISFEAELK